MNHAAGLLAIFAMFAGLPLFLVWMNRGARRVLQKQGVPLWTHDNCRCGDCRRNAVMGGPTGFVDPVSDFIGKKNEYVCGDGHRTVTVDRVAGTTPMMVGCLREGCPREAYSAWYKVDQELVPTHEWYAPTDAHLTAMYGADPVLLSQMRSHVRMGGLDIRKITEGGDR